MPVTIETIAEVLGARYVGDGRLAVDRIAEPAAAGPNDLALAMSPDYAAALDQSAARAAVLSEGTEGTDGNADRLTAAIYVARPRFALAGLTRLFDPRPAAAPGIHPSAIVDASATLGAGCSIGPHVVIGPGSRIGANARIGAQCVIGAAVGIGADAMILDGVRIGDRVQIGDRFIAQPGAVIGADGFSFTTQEKSTVESARETLGASVDVRAQAWVRIQSVGAVTIGDDVEVGANSTIDRGTIGDTRIGSGTKIDNLVQIGHNVRIGRDCLLCGQSGVAGSARIGDRVVIGGAASVADHLVVGDDAVIAGKSGVAANVPPGKTVMGYPAMPMERNVEAYKALRRLPRLVAQVAALQKAIGKRSDD